MYIWSCFVESQNWEPAHDMGSYSFMGTIMPNPQCTSLIWTKVRESVRVRQAMEMVRARKRLQEINVNLCNAPTSDVNNNVCMCLCVFMCLCVCVCVCVCV